MSWSFTINDVVQGFEIPPAVIEEFRRENEAYPADMELALKLAQEIGMKTATLTGYRTPSPYGGPDSIGVSVMGTIEGSDWFRHVKANIEAGPDQSDAATAARYQEHLNSVMDTDDE